MSAVKAEYRDGMIVLPRDLPKHADCEVTVVFPDDEPDHISDGDRTENQPNSGPVATDKATRRTLGDSEVFRSAAGGWRDLVDCDKLKEEIYRSRRDMRHREPKF